MTSIFDVAAYVLDKLGVMTTMKLEKLCYYSQAWSLVWDERRLFPERFEAWANGPVCPDLYHAHKGMFKITRGDIHGDPSNIDEDGTSTIDAVLNAYGKMGAYQLSELTHSERPWRDARGDLPQGAICNTEITEAAMAEYYGSLTEIPKDSVNRRIVFCFDCVDLEADCPWSLAHMSDEEHRLLLLKMRDFEKATVGEIISPSYQAFTCYPDFTQCPNQTPQDRLAKYYEREGDALARFRLGGTERLYGFLVGNEFHILWWDPNHEVWPSTRKHT